MKITPKSSRSYAVLVATATLVVALVPGQASAAALRHMTIDQASAAISAQVDKPNVAPGVELSVNVQSINRGSEPYTCAGQLIFPAPAKVFPPAATNEAKAPLRSRIGATYAGLAGFDVYLYRTAAQATTAKAKLLAAEAKCPRRYMGYYDWALPLVSFVRVSQGPYRLGDWRGWIEVSTTKVKGKVWRAYEGYVVGGNALLFVHWSAPAALETAALQHNVYNALLRSMTHSLATVKT